MGAPDLKGDTKTIEGETGLGPGLDLEVGKKETARTADLDCAIQATTFGRFHILLGLIGGLFYLSAGLQFGLLGYVLPFAKCDLDIGPNEMGFINALFMSGAIVCALFWGLIADTFGRRKVLIFALGMDGLCSILASWSNSYIMFALVRFVNGFLCGAPGAIGPTYIGEFFPDRSRARALCVVGFFWTTSWMLLPAISWAVIPADINLYTPYITYTSWRVMVALIGLPNIISSFLIWYFLTESPKFLYFQGHEEEARKVMTLMFAKNTGLPAEDYPIRQIVEDNKFGKKTSHQTHSRNKVMELLSAMGRQVKQLFTPPLLGRTTLSALIYLTNFIGYYGLLLWLPELYNRFENFYAQNPNGTASVCELSYLLSPNASRVDLGFEDYSMESGVEDCEDRTVNLAVFSNTFILGAGCCLSNVFVTLISDKVEGRLLTSTFMITGGACAFYIYYIKSAVQNVIVSTLFGVSINCTLLVVCFVVVNLFPTNVRSMGVSIAILSGRLGAVVSNLMFGMLIDDYCEIPVFLSGGSMILGGALCLLLPKQGQKATE